MTSVRAPLVRGLIPALVFLLTIVAFLPTLQNGFVNWDDESFLVANPHYRGLGWEQFRWMLPPAIEFLHAFTWVTYGLDYVFWGMNPLGYHLTSLLIHAANAVVSILSLCDSCACVWHHDLLRLPIRLAAGFAALFFALHPLQVEVVAWAIGREMAVAGFFFFLTLLCYLKAVENESMGSSLGWMVERGFSTRCPFSARKWR